MAYDKAFMQTKMTIYIDIDRSQIKIKTESLQTYLYYFFKVLIKLF